MPIDTQFAFMGLTGLALLFTGLGIVLEFKWLGVVPILIGGIFFVVAKSHG